MSRAQVTRLIARFGKTGRVKPTVYQRHRFAQRYTARDVELLARVDPAHETLSGPATPHILKREYEVYGKSDYERLASISVAHLYNLRKRPKYRQQCRNYTKTRATQVAIGERVGPILRGSRGSCGSILSIKAMNRAVRACTISMPSTRLRSGKLSPPSRGSSLAQALWHKQNVR